MGTQYLYDGRFDAARSEFNRVLAVDTSNAEASSKLIDCDIGSEIDNNTSDKGLLYIQLNTLMEHDSNDPFPYYFTGNLNIKEGDLTNAKSNYKIAISKDKSFADAYNYLGLVYDQEDDSPEALNNFKTAYDLSNGNALYARNIASVYYELGYFDDAKYWYETSINIDKMSLVLDTGYADTLRILDKLEDASEIQHKQMNFTPNNSMEFFSHFNILYVKTDSGEIVNINNYNMSKFYAYYDLALTDYLLGDETNALYSMKKANKIQIDNESKSNVLRILNININDLQHKQPKYINKTIEFQNKFEIV